MDENFKATLKSSETEDWLDLHVIRPFCYYCALAFAKFDVHPNTVTIWSMVIGAASAIFFGCGSFYYSGTWGFVMNLIAILLLMIALADAFLAETLDGVRMAAAGTIRDVLCALMLSRGAYFRRGVKRTFEEIRALHLPFDPEEDVLRAIRAGTPDGIRNALVSLMKKAEASIRCPREREEPTPENLSGTYEEMFSNWHGKMEEAIGRGDAYSSFMSLASLEDMIREIGESVRIEERAFLDRFDPDDLRNNLAVYDAAIADYLREYRKIGMAPRRYENADAFARAYLADTKR